jgi:class 3 adenylate cyclase
MGLLSDLQREIQAIFRGSWEIAKAQVVPDPSTFKLLNEARCFDSATVLYVDLSGATALVNNYNWVFAGEIYKAYLSCITKIVRHQGGVITAYGGDRIMAVFVNSNHASSAAVCGLKINWAVLKIVNPALKAQYPRKEYIVKQVVGIDTSELLVARVDVRSANDLLWIGRAANYSAKLSEHRNDIQTWITEQTHAALADWAKLGGNPPEDMWTRYSWTGMKDIPVYGSNWWWSLE